MFSKLKKSKTLRSLLGAASLFMAGAPSVAEAAPKAPQKITQINKVEQDRLKQAYLPLCAELEKNLPYCYYGSSGAMTVGNGVHFKDFSSLTNLPAVCVTPKKGKTISLTQLIRLNKLSDANWKDPKVRALFPEIESVVAIKTGQCYGECPKNTDKTWGKKLFLMPSQTLRKINTSAVDLCIEKAYQHHPDLFLLPPSVRAGIVDLIYNLGFEKYKKTFPRFQQAIRERNFSNAKKESNSGNARRFAARKYLMDASLLAKSSLSITDSAFLKKFNKKAQKWPNKFSPSREAAMWRSIETFALMDIGWYRQQYLKKQMLAQKGAKK